MPPDRPAVLLLTPLIHDERIWGRFARDLAARVDLTVGTWPGHGPGVDPSPHGFSRIEEIDRIVSRVGEPDAVIACSDDAAAAVHLALEGRAGALVLINPGAAVPLAEVPIDDFPERLERNLARIPDGLAELIENRDSAGLGSFIAGMHEGLLTPEDLALVRDVVTDNAEVFFAGPEYAHSSHSTTWWPDELGNVRVPVLGIAPDQTAADDLFMRLVHALVDRCPNGSFATVESETDYPWLEQPDDLARIVLDFIAANASPAGGR